MPSKVMFFGQGIHDRLPNWFENHLCCRLHVLGYLVGILQSVVWKYVMHLSLVHHPCSEMWNLEDIYNACSELSFFGKLAFESSIA